MIKVLFRDVDGVLNNGNSGPMIAPTDRGNRHFCERQVQ